MFRSIPVTQDENYFVKRQLWKYTLNCVGFGQFERDFIGYHIVEVGFMSVTGIMYVEFREPIFG